MRRSPRERAPLALPNCFACASVWVVLVTLLGLCPTPAHAIVELTISPALTVVDPGDSFTVELYVPSAGSPFNGYDAILGYDPELLRLLPEPSLAVREGELMVDACPTNRWNRFEVTPDSTRISITHVLLCAGVNVTGPGVLYRLRFAAKEQLAVTQLEFLEGTRVYDAGVLVDSLSTTGGVIQIGQDTGAPPPRPEVGLRAVPNPFNPSTVFHFRLPRSGPSRLRILGVDGRLVKELDLMWLEAGPQTVPWDGTDQEGRRIASGHYLAHLHHADGEAVCGAVLLK